MLTRKQMQDDNDTLLKKQKRVYANFFSKKLTKSQHEKICIKLPFLLAIFNILVIVFTVKLVFDINPKTEIIKLLIYSILSCVITYSFFTTLFPLFYKITSYKFLDYRLLKGDLLENKSTYVYIMNVSLKDKESYMICTFPKNFKNPEDFVISHEEKYFDMQKGYDLLNAIEAEPIVEHIPDDFQAGFVQKQVFIIKENNI